MLGNRKLQNPIDSLDSIPENREMAEWLKILISALAGMATGLVMEPLKHWISDYIAAHQAKRTIYAELARTYYAFKKWGPNDSHPNWPLGHIESQVFDYYYSSKREVLYLIPHYGTLISLNKTITRLKGLCETREKEIGEIVDTMLHLFQANIDQGLLDGNELAKQYQARENQMLESLRHARVWISKKE